MTDNAHRTIAVVVAREGSLPLGAVEASLEANGHVLVIGTGVDQAARELMNQRAAQLLRTYTIPTNDLGEVAKAVVTELFDYGRLLCPASPDGRDLAPRLAHLRGEPLYAGAIRVRPDRVTLTRASGHVGEEFVPPPRFVATLVPGTRGIEHPYEHAVVERNAAASIATGPGVVNTIAVDPPDAATMDLTEAKRIVGGGQGLGSVERFRELQRFATAIDASLGGTRVASDAGWIPFERQIGTTGVIVNPDLYLAFAISGATQHTTGLGDPDHVIAVNLDASCPMMAMADLAIVSDANAVVDALNRKLASIADDPDGVGFDPSAQ